MHHHLPKDKVFVLTHNQSRSDSANRLDIFDSCIDGLFAD